MKRSSKVAVAMKGGTKAGPNPAKPVLHHLASVLNAGVHPVERHLVLHFDVNKTIVLNDTVKRQPVKDVVNILLAEAAWGFPEVRGGKTVWVAATGERALAPEREGTLKRQMTGLAGVSRQSCWAPTRVEGAVTYLEHLEQIMPGKKLRKQREKLASQFTRPGCPGAALRSRFDELMKKVKPSSPARKNAKKDEEDNDGHVLCVLPAFYHMLVELDKAGRSFSVLFRSFGEDLPKLVQDFNSFCKGKHKDFPQARFDGSTESPNLLMGPEAVGSWFRAKDFYGMVWGELDLEKDYLESFGEGEVEPDAWNAFVDGLNLFRGSVGQSSLRSVSTLAAVASEIRKRTEVPCAMALRDYFPIWNCSGRKGASGKLLPIRYQDDHRVDMFFDDNLSEDGGDLNIVNAQFVYPLFKAIRPVYALRYHVVRADALAAINNLNWFVEKIHEKEAALDIRSDARRNLREFCLKFMMASKSGRLEIQSNGFVLSTKNRMGPTMTVKFVPSDENEHHPWRLDTQRTLLRASQKPKVRSNVFDEGASNAGDAGGTCSSSAVVWGGSTESNPLWATCKAILCCARICCRKQQQLDKE